MARKKMCKLKEIKKGGFLKKVTNPCGKKAPIVIYQGMKPGFSAMYAKSGRTIPGSSRNAEAYARRLARSGHKKVTFRD